MEVMEEERRDTFKRMADDAAYDRQCIEKIVVGYRQYLSEGAFLASLWSDHPTPVRGTQTLQPQRSCPGARTFTPNDLKKHGYTVGCPGWEAVELGLDERRNHNEACRARIEEAIAAHPDGRGRLQRTKDRMDRKTVQLGEPMIDIQGEQAQPAASSVDAPVEVEADPMEVGEGGFCRRSRG